MKRKTNLEYGFLFLYDWLPAFQNLPAKEFKALMLALIDRQREGKALPAFRNPMTEGYAHIIETVIRRRLEGAKHAQKGQAPQGDPSGDPMGDPQGYPVPYIREEKEKITVNSISKEEGEGEKSPAPPASGPLSEQEKQVLLSKGLPAAYLEQCGERAAAYAHKTGRDLLRVLCEWWKKDKYSFAAAQKAAAIEKAYSFDTNEFFKAAMERTYEGFQPCGEISPETG